MEFKHLLSYATVVRLGSFSKAAEELYIAQPTISLHVRQLEEELRTKLLIRTTKSLELTEKGREVYECAVSILQLRDRITEKCTEGESRIIRLGASTIPSAYILPEILPAYVKQHPATYFTIDQGDSRSVTEKLTEGVIDIGLIGIRLRSGSRSRRRCGGGSRLRCLFHGRYSGSNSLLGRLLGVGGYGNGGSFGDRLFGCVVNGSHHSKQYDQYYKYNKLY